MALTFWWKGRGLLEPAERALGRALVAGDPAPSSLRAHALWARAYLTAYAGRIEAALGGLQEAYAMAEEVGDQSALARSLMALGFLQGFPDPLGSRATSERARDLARACGDDWALITSNLNLAYTHLVRHEIDDCERLLDEMLPFSQEHGYLELQAWHWSYKCFRPALAADSAQVCEYAERALGLARTVGDPTMEALAQVFRWRLELASGTPEAALERMQATHARLIAGGAGMAYGYTLGYMALAQATLGDLGDARAALEQVVAGGMDQGWALAVATGDLADVLRVAGEPVRAEACAGATLAIGERVGNPMVIAVAKEILGRVAAGRADWGRADGLLHEALTIRIDRDLLTDVPRSFDALAEVAGGLGSHAEAARALGIAQAARAELGLVRWAPDEPCFAQLEGTIRHALGDDGYDAAYQEGWELQLDEAVIWIRGARGERKRPARGWESLTPTELRVVGFVAEGLTNPQIAARMFISRGTVKVHVSHIFAKLGIDTRSELAAEATRRELIL